MQEKVNKEKKSMIKKTKQSVFKYEKQHKENPNICRKCGVLYERHLVNGICNNCYNLKIREASAPDNVFKVDKKDGEQFRK